MVHRYRSKGVEMREEREKYVIPGLTKEAAAEITRQRKAAEAAAAAAEKQRTAAASAKKHKKKGGQKKPADQPDTDLHSANIPLKKTQSVKADKPTALIPKAEENAHNQSSENDPEELKRLLRAENKRLRQIIELEERQKKGEQLNADQMSKLRRRAEVEALIEKLSTLTAS
ncbi:unnamed protein product [Schistocephalus solidus]|uniref:Partner of Y14 and mago n=1 Tax=Schistocephalus solidus TaxID=70667 RepID=A0A183SJD4_SCHSO|nr:unnamed protein product [Schistocephalus solidus]